LFQLITPSQLAQVVQEALRTAQDQLRATIQFFLRIPQRAAAVVVDVLADRFMVRMTVDREQAQPVQAVFWEVQATRQALHPRKETTAVMVMVQHFGKAVEVAVRGLLA
jgi:acyl carrier protein phosphodiesterase